MSTVIPGAEKYAIQHVEKKWQNYWYENHVFLADSNSGRPPFYVLEMFPYPSGTLHMGHARNYAIGDALARFRWANGYEVLHPMGWDACGLPAENAAIKHKVNPKKWTYDNAYVMKQQCLSLGFSHDWSREFFSCDPSYFQHEQKMFLDFYAHGLAYRKESYVNWDPKEQSVLANEQVVDGKGWRSGAVVEKRLLKQWFLKITDFAQQLLDDLEGLTQWPDAVRDMQKHWIGQSKGLHLRFERAEIGTETGAETAQETAPEKGAETRTETAPKKILEIFTTRPETLFGASFCAISWDHPWVQDVLPQYLQDVDLLVQESRQRGTSSRIMETAAQKGALTGLYVEHPLVKGKTIPVVVANYVASDYGTGALFGCPGHDSRDYGLARLLDLPIVYVVKPETDSAWDHTGPYTGDGVMVGSDFLNGLDLENARTVMIDYCTQQGVGRAQTMYRLRDWGVGRQRYWGVPIPIIYCETCGVVPVPAKDLPVILPEDVCFDQPGNPLHNHPTWKDVHCPSCGGHAQRETDTFDTFFESSWYFARFCDPHNAQRAFDADVAQHWLPVHQYVGGIEHAVMHLLYARFFTKALKKCGYWDLSEPFQGMFTQGMVCHKTFQAADGTWLLPEEVDGMNRRLTDGTSVSVGRSEKMSKSKCNVVGVTQMVDTYGADAVRLFVLSDTPPQKDLEWSEEGIEGAWRYVRRLWALFQEFQVFYASGVMSCGEMPHGELSQKPETFSDPATALRRHSHKSLVALQQAMDGYGLNKYVAILREWSNLLGKIIVQTSHGQDSKASKQDIVLVQDSASDMWALQEVWVFFIQAIAPIMPHLAEEMASHLGLHPGIHRMPWPLAEPELLVEDRVTVAVQINGKHRGTLSVPVDATEQDIVVAIQGEAAFQKYIQGVWVKTIVVPGRMVSLVVRDPA